MLNKLKKLPIVDKGSAIAFWLLLAAFAYLYGRVFYFVFD